MKKVLNFHIANPCQENWNEMTPNIEGRFCDRCTKTVIDFTNMQQDTIQDYIKKNQTKSICARIKQKMINKTVIQLPLKLFKQNLSAHKLFTRIACLHGHKYFKLYQL